MPARRSAMPMPIPLRPAPMIALSASMPILPRQLETLSNSSGNARLYRWRMRYIIIGAGAIGGSIGGRLHESGQDVLLVARGRHFEALRARGLKLRLPAVTLDLRIPAVDDPEQVDLRADDVLILAVKT